MAESEGMEHRIEKLKEAGKLERKSEFSITIKVARSREAALSTISDMLKPKARAALSIWF
jgi:hypothetical protein